MHTSENEAPQEMKQCSVEGTSHGCGGEMEQSFEDEDGNGSVFKYTQQVCKFQIVTTGRLLATLDIRPNHRLSHLTTDSHTTTNRAALLTAPETATLILGLVTLPTYHMKDRNQAQTLSGMWHYHLY